MQILLLCYSSLEVMKSNVKLNGCMTRKMGQVTKSDVRNRKAKVFPRHEKFGKKHARQLLETEKLPPQQGMAHYESFRIPDHLTCEMRKCLENKRIACDFLLDGSGFVY
jgi:hypothetical protein